MKGERQMKVIRIFGGIRRERCSAAKAVVHSVDFLRGLKPPPPSVWMRAFVEVRFVLSHLRRDRAAPKMGHPWSRLEIRKVGAGLSTSLKYASLKMTDLWVSEERKSEADSRPTGW